MSEMVALVAKAIFDETFCTHDMPMPGYLHKKYLAIARAAIAAMREPTRAIIIAAVPEDAWWDDLNPSTVFSRMIDEALK